MGGEGPSEGAGGGVRLPMEGMGGFEGGEEGAGEEKGEGRRSAASLLTWLKHLHACLTQEVLKKERD